MCISKTMIALIGLMSMSVYSVVMAQEPSASQQQISPSVKEVNYLCEHNIELPVVYFTDAEKGNYAVALIEGNLILMQQRQLTTGEFYIAVNEQTSYRLQADGTKASVTFMEASDDVSTTNVLSVCEAYDDNTEEE